MKVTVAGAGAWGTALAALLRGAGHSVTLWGHTPAHLAEIEQAQENKRYLAGVKLPPGIEFTPDFKRACSEVECIVIAVPSRAIREVTRTLNDFTGLLVSVTKGIEYESGATMSTILAENAPNARIGALSGPTLAFEVARNIPAAIVAASDTVEVAEAIQNLFHSRTFRVYTSTDLPGVELGGALKNVIAIGAGVCDGLGFGDNSKAALITRAIVEIRRLGVACSANADTFSGLSGLGDLTVTCFSKLSRNRAFGERLGHGESLDTVLNSTESIAEGYPTARSAFHLAHKLQVSTPIIDEVYAMLFESKDIAMAVRDLTCRDSKSET
ncbi:MAG: Glycerol-3-phosphate dehydrogenase [Verrucomicrobiales bacterium]|nr:Glycerol-3-phosphate dehydrogenase [Verrucomicrobiales bacterium]